PPVINMRLCLHARGVDRDAVVVREPEVPVLQPVVLDQGLHRIGYGSGDCQPPWTSISSVPAVSAFFSFVTIDLGMSLAAALAPTARVRPLTNLLLRIT